MGSEERAGSRRSVKFVAPATCRASNISLLFWQYMLPQVYIITTVLKHKKRVDVFTLVQKKRSHVGYKIFL